MATEMLTHTGGCHCGRVRFELRAPRVMSPSRCNCSICAKSSYVGYSVPKDRFTLLQGEDALSTYTFNKGIAQHLFCSHCGIKSFYVPRSHPDGINVNVSCLDPGTFEVGEVRAFNGREWETQYPKGRAESYPE